MPPYGNLTEIKHGVYTLWNSETPNPGSGGSSASSEVGLPLDNEPWSINGFFSGDPGVFEIDIQAAGQNIDSEFQTIANGNMTSVDPINYTFHFSSATKARFIRLLMRTRTNSVAVTARMTR